MRNKSEVQSLFFLGIVVLYSYQVSTFPFFLQSKPGEAVKVSMCTARRKAASGFLQQYKLIWWNKSLTQGALALLATLGAGP